ncbi:MAG: tetratricopeptide repeat protein [Elusimicrobiales bacterium]|nr:tetratricopeptide repeat protein [Elusimicrobiales bacterium]
MIKNRVYSLLLAVAFAVPAAAQGTEELSPAANPDISSLPGFAGKEEAPSAAVTAPAEAKPPAAAEAPARVIDPSPSDEVVSPAARLSAREAEWAFLKAASARQDREITRIVMTQISGWLSSGPLDSTAAEAQLLKAEMRLRLKDYREATVDLLKQLQLYPGSEAARKAASLLEALVSERADKKLRPLLLELAKPFDKPAKEDRMAMLLGRLAAEAGSDYHDPLVEEFRLFFERFPSYPGRDALQRSLAAMHAAKKEHVAARVAYEKLIAMHPSTPLMAAARLALANLLADDLKEYDGAVDAYLDVTVSFPGTPEAWEAYGRLPALAERQKKYALAVETHEKIIALYPDRPEAYDAYMAAARVLRERMGKTAEAVSVLVRLADKYGGEKGHEALFLAAEITRKDIKDAAAEAVLYDKIVAEYEKDGQAPRAMYAAGESWEKAKNYDMARQYYMKLSEKYRDDKFAARAQKRLDSILGK